VAASITVTLPESCPVTLCSTDDTYTRFPSGLNVMGFAEVESPFSGTYPTVTGAPTGWFVAASIPRTVLDGTPPPLGTAVVTTYVRSPVGLVTTVYGIPSPSGSVATTPGCAAAAVTAADWMRFSSADL
jgi:hypothetical protein